MAGQGGTHRPDLRSSGAVDLLRTCDTMGPPDLHPLAFKLTEELARQEGAKFNKLKWLNRFHYS